MDLLRSKVLVTGGSGFLGSHVVKHLAHNNMCQDVIVPRSAEFDLTRQCDAESMYRYYEPDVVIHLAASVGGIQANKDNPGKYFYDNMSMGLNMVESARLYNIDKLVVVGTVCSYPLHTDIPFKEQDIWKGYPETTNAPYGIAKKALWTMCKAYHNQYGLRYAYVLPVNLYGPQDNFDLHTSHVIPALIRKFISAQAHNQTEVTLWGTGNPSREFLYVEDCAHAIITATMKYDDLEPMNIGTGEEVTIKALADRIADLVGYQGNIIWDSSHLDGQPRRCLDITRMKEKLNYIPPTGLTDGLRMTIDWYREHYGES